MDDFVAHFEPGSWRDFSKEHAVLRQRAETSIAAYRGGRGTARLAVWGGYGAGKTQFLFAVAEMALTQGCLPIYIHLNDLLDGLPKDPSPDAFKEHANAFAQSIAADL